MGDGAFIGVFKTSGFAFGCEKTLRIDFGGRPKERGKNGEGDLSAASWTRGGYVRVAKERLRQSAVTTGAKDKHGA